MDFSNVYEDAVRAKAYSKMEFPGTYYLAYRDLPEIIARHVNGTRAVDFGCGAGRSTRFLKNLGFDAVGIDISPDMLNLAKNLDPGGDYRLVSGAQFGLPVGSFDLVLSVFTFDNIPTPALKIANFSRLAALLGSSGRMVNLVSAPEIYTHEWASFSTKDFPENWEAKSGDTVRIIQTDIEDRRPVVDILWSDESYREVFAESGLAVDAVYRPLGRNEEPFDWVNETSIPPWMIYVLKRSG